MIIIWRGWGITVPFIFGIAAYVAHLVLQQILGVSYCHLHMWPRALSVLMGGFVLGFVGQWLDRQDDGEGNSLYFIPMKYWGVLAVVVGIGLFFASPADPNAQTVKARERTRPAIRAAKSETTTPPATAGGERTAPVRSASPIPKETVSPVSPSAPAVASPQ